MVDLKEKEDIIEIVCKECQAEMEIKYLESESGEPEYCPFCGADVLYEDDEEEDDFDEEYHDVEWDDDPK